METVSTVRISSCQTCEHTGGVLESAAWAGGQLRGEAVEGDGVVAGPDVLGTPARASTRAVLADEEGRVLCAAVVCTLILCPGAAGCAGGRRRRGNWRGGRPWSSRCSGPGTARGAAEASAPLEAGVETTASGTIEATTVVIAQTIGRIERLELFNMSFLLLMDG